MVGSSRNDKSDTILTEEVDTACMGDFFENAVNNLLFKLFYVSNLHVNDMGKDLSMLLLLKSTIVCIL